LLLSLYTEALHTGAGYFSYVCLIVKVIKGNERVVEG
jgi:hypothetical protein